MKSSYVCPCSDTSEKNLICTDNNWLPIYICTTQSHYREFLRWEIFMEHELRFGLDFGRLALLKKKLGQLSTTFKGRFFHVFMGKKNEK